MRAEPGREALQEEAQRRPQAARQDAYERQGQVEGDRRSAQLRRLPGGRQAAL